jgi:PAS domain S-box-containing protein
MVLPLFDEPYSRLKEIDEKLRFITNAAKDAIVTMDDQGIIGFWNPAAERIFGYAATEAIGKELHVLLAPPRPFQEMFLEEYRRLFVAETGAFFTRTLEFFAGKKDGAEFPVELSLSALLLNGAWYAVGILRDISERRRSAEELRTHREELERRVAERTGELNAVTVMRETGRRDQREGDVKTG